MKLYTVKVAGHTYDALYPSAGAAVVHAMALYRVHGATARRATPC
jgi:hypothetical protein